MSRQLLLLVCIITSLSISNLFAQPDCAILISPVDNAIDQELSINFMWQAAATGDVPTSYTFYAGEDPGNLTNFGNTTSTSTTVSSFFELDKTYYWEVVANSAGGSSSGCDVYTFDTKSIPQAPGVSCGPTDTDISYVDDMEATTGWTGDIGGFAAWTLGSGKTPSGIGGTTGPFAAFSGSNYFFYESSTSDASTPDASLISPAFDLTAATGTIDFTFQMFAHGSDIETLEVAVGTSATGPFTNIWTWDGPLQSSQADAWQMVGFDLETYAGQTIYLEFKHVTNGSGGGIGDIAIDLLTIDACEPGIVANDECANAEELNSDGTPGSLFDQSTANATTSSLADPSCGPTATNDVFYTIESDIDGGGLDITLTPGAGSRFVAVLYEGTCAGLTELVCEMASEDGEVLTLNYFATGFTDKYGGVTRSAAEFFVLRVYDLNDAGEDFDLAVSGSGVAALPIVLTDWRATLQDRSVALQWTTAQEFDTDRFEIEKSMDGRSWFPIHTEQAAGFSQEIIRYSYEDFDLSQKQYYRLRSIDLDNSQSVSSTISIMRDDLDLAIYPNPATEFISVGHQINDAQAYQVQIYSMQGQLVIDNNNIEITNGNIDISALPSGLYSIMLQREGQVYQTNFVKK